MSTKFKSNRDVSMEDVSMISKTMTKLTTPTAGAVDEKNPDAIILVDNTQDPADVCVGVSSYPYESEGSDSSIYKKKHMNSRKTDSRETSDNPNRQELLWTKPIEGIIKGWYNKCLKNSNNHAEHSRYQKKIYYGLGIPATIIPLVLATLVTTLVDDWSWINTVSLIIAGIINIINGYLNPGGKEKEHQEFEAMYGELAVEITSELVKPQGNRQAADVFIQRIMDRYNNLNNRAPPT